MMKALRYFGAGCLVVFLFCAACSRMELRPAAHVDEKDLLVYASAAEKYHAGHYREAAQMLSSVKRFLPALVLKGKGEYFAGDASAAEKSFRRALKMRPPSAEALLYLARICREKGEIQGALNLTELLLSIDPAHIGALRLASGLAQEKGDGTEAAALLDRAVEASAETALVYLDRAHLRWIGGRAGEALQDLERVKALLPWDTPLARSVEKLEKTINESLKESLNREAEK